ncbi:hypothetical protein TWF696_000674 [Orbilia brochopaga]|uniref:CENP-V/GFA domain-containing protein n=1 Tax=Orbilia brochopaga TaxID=3140254 RepID=A0AAV9VD71_9PEZI
MAEAASGAHDPISGGCLCKAVRYSVAFPEGSWPPQRKAICHCTQCRKSTGALMAHVMTVEPQRVTWTCEDRSFREYSSSPGVFRGFCQNCGSTLSWRSLSTPAEIELFTGTLDESVLVGGDGETGRAIVAAERQIWCVNRIKGVSDGAVSREMYKTGADGEVFQAE